jgi:hypothetical protein
MKKLLLGLALSPFIAGIAVAQEPTKLTGQQMDKVSAGWFFFVTECTSTTVIPVSISLPPAPPPPHW